MAFSSEEEQLRKFRNDESAQHYFEVLRTLISKNLFFAQNIGLYDDVVLTLVRFSLVLVQR